MKNIHQAILLTIAVFGILLVSFSNTLAKKFVDEKIAGGASASILISKKENPTGASASILASKKDHHPQRTFQSFNTTNPHDESWCPNVTCNNSPMCAPCNRRYFFIVATGRSGSTSLLKMFNNLPNVRLSGELNRDVLKKIRNVLFLLNEKPQMRNYDKDLTEGAFMHNAIPKQSMSCTVQDLFYKINPPPRAIQLAVNETITNEDGSLRPGISIHEYDKHMILGFKAIRIHSQGWNPSEAAKFFQEHFPCSKILINTRRNVTEQLRSVNKSFTMLKNKRTLDDLEEDNAFLENFGKILGEVRVKSIRMEDWMDDINILNDVVDWLGFKNCSFQSVLHENLNGYGHDYETHVGLDERCHYPFLTT